MTYLTSDEIRALPEGSVIIWHDDLGQIAYQRREGNWWGTAPGFRLTIKGVCFSVDGGGRYTLAWTPDDAGRDRKITCPDCASEDFQLPRARCKRGRAVTRTRTSAKAAGTRFERAIADTLAYHVDDRIDRRVKTGSKDRGDIAGLRHMGERVIIECKDTTRTNLGTWASEADIERGNDDAIAGLIAHKRHGNADPLDQWITCTMRDLIALLTGSRPA